MKKLLVVFCLIIGISSCQNLMMHMAGLHEPHAMSNEEILEASRHFGLAGEGIYVLDTVAYRHLADSLKQRNTKDYQDIMQPLQIKFFENNDSLVFHLVNCSVGGFPNLRWNRLKSFDTYPPSMAYFRTVNYNLRFSTDTVLYHLIRTNPKPEPPPDATVVVFWSRMMGRQSNRLIRETVKYKNRFPLHRIRILFVNNDNLYK
jgi:hypothetical protein